MADSRKLNSCKGLRGRILCFALTSVPVIVIAAPPEIYVGFDARASDNIAETADDKQSDIENRAFLRGSYQTDPGRCVASIDGQISYSVYADSTFDPETRLDGGALGRCELATGLYWSAENQISDVERSSRFGNTPDNRTRKNIFRTGPDYRWRLSPRDSIQFSSRYENTEFSDPEDIDSNRVTGSIAWNHLFSSDFSAGLSTAISEAELDTDADIRTQTVSVTFNKRWATTSLSGSLGVSEIETEQGSFKQKSDGLVGDLNLTRVLDSSASVYVRASRELTDQTSDFDIRFDDFTFERQESITLEATIVETGLNKTFSNGDSMVLAAYANRSDYLDSAEQEDRIGLRAGYTRRLSPSVSAVANARYDYLTFESDQSDDQVTGLDIGLNYQASRRLELRGRIGRNERTSDNATQEYEENWVLVGIEYRLR
jgi:hypothetical protein